MQRPFTSNAAKALAPLKLVGSVMFNRQLKSSNAAKALAPLKLS